MLNFEKNVHLKCAPWGPLFRFLHTPQTVYGIRGKVSRHGHGYLLTMVTGAKQEVQQGFNWDLLKRSFIYLDKKFSMVLFWSD